MKAAPSVLDILFPKVRAEILRLLFSEPAQQRYVRELMVLSGLALGNAPSVAREAPRFGHAASFALRKFDGKPLAAEPTREALSQVSSRFPEARLMLYLKRGGSLAREMKWLGSYRYAVVNMGAASPADLYQRYADMRAALFTE